MAEFCPYCGHYHDPMPEFDCGCDCGLGSEACADCMEAGGPMPQYGQVNEDDREDRDVRGD